MRFLRSISIILIFTFLWQELLFARPDIFYSLRPVAAGERTGVAEKKITEGEGRPAGASDKRVIPSIFTATSYRGPRLLYTISPAAAAMGRRLTARNLRNWKEEYKLSDKAQKKVLGRLNEIFSLYRKLSAYGRLSRHMEPLDKTIGVFRGNLIADVFRDEEIGEDTIGFNSCLLTRARSPYTAVFALRHAVAARERGASDYDKILEDAVFLRKLNSYLVETGKEKEYDLLIDDLARLETAPRSADGRFRKRYTTLLREIVRQESYEGRQLMAAMHTLPEAGVVSADPEEAELRKKELNKLNRRWRKKGGSWNSPDYILSIAEEVLEWEWPVCVKLQAMIDEYGFSEDKFGLGTHYPRSRLGGKIIGMMKADIENGGNLAKKYALSFSTVSYDVEFKAYAPEKSQGAVRDTVYSSSVWRGKADDWSQEVVGSCIDTSTVVDFDRFVFDIKDAEMRLAKRRGGGYIHPGLDIRYYRSVSGEVKGLPYGLPVMAVAGGVVEEVVNNYIIIRHTGPGAKRDLFSAYAHIEQVQPWRVGDFVEAGQIIGLTAADSIKVTPHLHIELLHTPGGENKDVTRNEVLTLDYDEFSHKRRKQIFVDPLPILSPHLKIATVISPADALPIVSAGVSKDMDLTREQI